MFSIQMLPPRAMATPPDFTMEAALKTATFPSVQVGDLGIARMGLKFPVPGDLTMGEVSVGFYNDVEFLVRDFFTKWIKLYANDFGNGYLAVPADAMSGRVVLNQHAGSGEIIKSCVLFHAWPSNVGEIQLSHDSENGSEEFTVTFAYSYFKWSKTSTAARPKSVTVSSEDDVDGADPEEALNGREDD